MASMQMCGATITKKTGIIITVIGSLGIAVGIALIIAAAGVGCYYDFDDYYYDTDCTTAFALYVTGIFLLCASGPVLVTGCVMLCNMRNRRPQVAVPLPTTIYNGQPYVQQTAGLYYPQQRAGQPYLQQGAVPPYPQQEAAPPYPHQGAVPPYPQEGAVPPYPQQESAPPYPQQGAAPPYPQQGAAPPYPHQGAVPPPGADLPYSQGPDQSAY